MAISVGQNLDVALRHLRLEHKSRLIWIDALCINQSSTDERNRQVALMGKIFQLAECVIVWLGPEADNSNEAIDLMQHLSQHIEMNWSDPSLSSSRSTSEPGWGDIRIELPYIAGELTSVCALLERPYFERTWIRQEVTLARYAVVLCGRKRISWTNFSLAVACLKLKPSKQGAIEKKRIAVWRKVIGMAYTVCGRLTGYYEFTNIRFTLRDAKCQDPRDQIYALLSLLWRNDRQLEVRPDYSQTGEQLYVTVAWRILSNQLRLELFESCELSSRVLDIPSWVPDWSSRVRSKRMEMKWSACGWISAQVSITEYGSICVSGVRVAQVAQVTDIDMNEYDYTYDDILHALRKCKPPPSILAVQEKTWNNTKEMYCRAFNGNNFADTYWPPKDTCPSIAETREDLELVWSSDASWDEFPDYRKARFSQYLRHCHSMIVGRSFFRATNGCLGFAPIGTRKDDVLCVLLGCEYPVVLRLVPDSGSVPTWQLLGVCYASGLMDGEAIYGNKLPRHYQSIRRPEEWIFLINGRDFALHDLETGDFKTDPAEILTEMGIKVESYQRNPHLLKVLPETLRAAGVALEDFVLV